MGLLDGRLTTSLANSTRFSGQKSFLQAVEWTIMSMKGFATLESGPLDELAGGNPPSIFDWDRQKRLLAVFPLICQEDQVLEL